MSTPVIQTSFSAGELAPSLWGQVDLAKYQVGLATARNGFISYKGGFYSRAGTAFVGFSKQTGRSVPPRLITFQFSINQGLALEFGNLYMRVISNGAFVTDSTKAITALTRANPGVFTSNAHGFSNGDWVDLSGILGMTQLNGLTGIVANVTANTYTLTDVYGTAIDTTGFTAYTSGGAAARIFTLVTPWAELDLDYLKWTQSADVMSICCWNQATGTSYPPYDLTRLADDNWSVAQPTFSASISPPGTLSATAQSTAPATTWYSYKVTAVDKDTGEESIASDSTDIENNDIAVYFGSNVIAWSAVAGAASYNIYKAMPTYDFQVPAGESYGYMSTAFGQQTTDRNITPDYAKVPPVHSDPFAPGQITNIMPNAPGINYSQQTVGYSITTATGSGFVGTPVVTDGGLSGFLIENPGRNYAPADTIAITDSGGGRSTGTFSLLTVNPTDGDQAIFNNVQVEFKNAPISNGAIDSGKILCEIGRYPLGLTIVNLANALTSAKSQSLTCATYTVTATNELTITFNEPGAQGDNYTLDADTSHGTRSGPNLTGGGTVGSGATATLTVGDLTGTYPSVVSYFQERRAYAASPNQPDTYWMSQTGQFKNFDFRTPPVDSDALTGTPWSLEVNGIQWFVSMPGGLVTLTGLSAWQLTGAGGSGLNAQAISPNNQQAQQQSFNGASATVPPIQIGPEIVYLQAKGSVFRDLSYNYFTNIYTGVDLTVLSSQLFTGYTMKPGAWCEEPYKLMWAPRDDGTLLSLTFLKVQDVVAWARHDTNGQFWSVCSVTEPPVDALYLATQRYPGGKNAYMIERMNDRIWSSVEDCWCVDCGLELTQPAPNATLTASSATGSGVPTAVTGLVGGSGYSGATAATINDPTGTGAAVNLTIAAGVITSALISGGSGYTYPVLVFDDPNGTGSGASGAVTLDTNATFTASAGVFSAGSVGSVIRMGGGIATVTSYNSATSVSAQITSPIVRTIPNSGGVPMVAQSGEWSITTPVSTLTGLQHLAGSTVVGIADGVPLSARLVSSTGTVALDRPATSVVMGYAFLPQAQSLDLNAGQPTIQGRRKKIAAVTARLEASYVPGAQAGANQPNGSALNPPQIAPAWSNNTLQVPPDQNLPPYGSTVTPLFSGDVRVPLSGGFAKPGQVAIQQTEPLPLSVLAFIPEILPGDEPELQAPQKQKGARQWQPDQAA